ncbi:MAG: hypothetical protein RL095_3204 [Verrucomicrobiota bacterium]|jgi:3-oxoacyl-[acyl-carrier protein] reductase
MRLKDKVVIVTGGSRGIGLALVRRLLAEGAKVAFTGTRQESLDKAIAALGDSATNAKGYVLDVAQAAACEAMVKQVIADLGAVHVLVNNAGITKDTLMMRMKEEDWDSVIDTNLKGAFNCLKAVTRPMMGQRSGRIINISSVVGLMGNAGQVNYAASKAGMLGMTKAAAKELASRGITVNAIAPGFIASDMTEVISEDAKKSYLSAIPLNRFGTGDEIASAVVFLASDESAYITGQTLNVDGGMVMQ